MDSRNGYSQVVVSGYLAAILLPVVLFIHIPGDELVIQYFYNTVNSERFLDPGVIAIVCWIHFAILKAYFKAENYHLKLNGLKSSCDQSEPLTVDFKWNTNTLALSAFISNVVVNLSALYIAFSMFFKLCIDKWSV